MGDLSEMLKDGYAAHERALGASAGAGLTGRAVRDVRTRRAWRAGATGAVAAVSVGAVAAGAWGVGGAGLFGASGGPASGGLEVGACSAYVPANPDVLPPSYEGRAYVDLAAGFVMAVDKDGTAHRVTVDANGLYMHDYGNGSEVIATVEDDPRPAYVTDRFGSWGFGVTWTGAELTGYDWTAVPRAEAPRGVYGDLLWTVLMGTTVNAGYDYDPDMVPIGAVTQFVATYDDGSEYAATLTETWRAPVLEPAAGRGAEWALTPDGLDSVALRVTLVDGTEWEMRFEYTPENVPDLPCQVTPPSGGGQQDVADPAPSEGAEYDTGVSEGPAPWTAAMRPLDGPESRVFACGAPLPADLEDSTSATAKREPGIALSEADTQVALPDRLTIKSSGGAWPVTMDALREVNGIPGWFTFGEGATGMDLVGGIRYEQVVAVRDGVVVGYANEPQGEPLQSDASYYEGMHWTDGDTHGVSSEYTRIDDLMVPCDASSAADLAGTSLALLYGSGPTLDDVAYAWTAVQE